MRSFSLLAFVALAVTLAACTDSPTSTIDVTLGQTTVEAIQANTGNAAWYQPGYDSYPAATNLPAFKQQVDIIKANLDTAAHSIVMVIRPSCGCQNTWTYFPPAIKTLDSAGFPHSKIGIYVTDSRMAGIDSVKAKYNVTIAPTFIVLKNGVEKGRIAGTLETGKSIEQSLAEAFAQP